MVAEAELLVLACHADLQASVADSKRLGRLLDLAMAPTQDSHVRMAGMNLLLAVFCDASSATTACSALREAGALAALPQLLSKRMEAPFVKCTALHILRELCRERKNAELLGVLHEDALPSVLACMSDAAQQPQVAHAALQCAMAVASASADARAALMRATPFVYLAQCAESVVAASGEGGVSHAALACLEGAMRCCKLLLLPENHADIVTSGAIRSLLHISHMQSVASGGLGTASAALHSRLSVGAVPWPQWLQSRGQPQQLAVLLQAQAAWESATFASACVCARGVLQAVLASASAAQVGVWSNALREEASAATRALYAVNLLERALGSASGLSVGQILPLLDRLLDILLARGDAGTAAARRRVAPLAWRAMHTIAYNAYCVNIGSTRRSKLVLSSPGPSMRGGAGAGSVVDGASVFSAADTVMSHATTTNPGVLKARSLYMFRLLWEEGFYTGDAAARERQEQSEAGAGAEAEAGGKSSAATAGLTSLQELLERVSQLTEDITVRRRGTVRFDSMGAGSEGAACSAGGDEGGGAGGDTLHGEAADSQGSPVRRATQTPLLVPTAPVWSEEVPSMVMQLAMLSEALCSSSPAAQAGAAVASTGPQAPSAPPKPPASPSVPETPARQVGSPGSVASPPPLPPTPGEATAAAAAPWPSVQDNAEQAKQVRTLLGYGIVWLQSYAQRQVCAPASRDIARVVAAAAAAGGGGGSTVDALHTDESRDAVRKAGMRSFGVRWKQWQMPLLARMARSAVPEVCAFAALCLRDALLQLAARRTAEDKLDAFPAAGQLVLAHVERAASRAAAATQAPSSPLRDTAGGGLSDIARAVSGLDSLRMSSPRESTPVASADSSRRTEQHLEVPLLCKALCDTPPGTPADAGAWARSLHAACDAIPWAVRMQVGHTASSSTVAVMPSSVSQLQEWQHQLAASDAASARSADALQAQLQVLGARGILDDAVRDAGRSSGCVVSGCDAVCRQVLLDCRLALGEHTSVVAPAAQGTPQKRPKGHDTAASEVVSPFMLAAE